MKGYVEVNAMGNVGNVEVKYNQEGEPIGLFSIAANESYTKKDGTKVENTTWINVTVFGGQAKIVRDYVTKGAPIAIRGAKLKIEEYEGKKYTKVILDNFNGKLTLLGSKKEAAPAATEKTDSEFQASDDDVPF
jgi:single-strand DNA-binding protein